MLMPAGIYTGHVVALAWISNTLPRPPAKVSQFDSTLLEHLPFQPSSANKVPSVPQPSQRSTPSQIVLRMSSLPNIPSSLAPNSAEACQEER